MTILEQFLKSPGRQPCARDSIIFSEGDRGGAMYAVVSGEVEIMIHGTVVETVGPGGFFGEMAIIDDEPRSGTAIAKSDCELVAIDEAAFRALAQENPDFALAVIRVLARRLRRMDDHI